jgi:phytoene dehydrogenase-like protein
MDWDTIVIGSGAGGLAAAVTLARAGQKVLILEQHYLPGGWTHSFHLGGYRFSPGVHYLGELGPGQGLRNMFESLGVAPQVEFNELNPDGFDHFIIGNERFNQPNTLAGWIVRLKQRFPSQVEGIDGYFSTLLRIVDDLRRSNELLRFPQILALPFRGPSLLRWGFSTLQSLLDKYITDPLLSAVLSAQCGNHGLPPWRVSLPAHAMMSAHYFGGAWYPRGGARTLPLAFIKQLRAHGGRIRTRARVRRIIVERGRACGVHLSDGERIDAGQIICNADPGVTYGSLLEAPYCRREVRKLERTEYSSCMLSVFCAVDLPLEAMGYDSGNYWWFKDPYVGGVYGRVIQELPSGEMDALFLSISSLKDPSHASHGHHTIEMFAFVPWKPFSSNERDAAYQALKQSLGDRVLASAENVIPGLRRHLKFMTVGTPLTNAHYCNVVQGSSYGTAKTPFQVGPFGFSQRGPVKGLYLCGASTLGHGVAGATYSGIVAAQELLADAPPQPLPLLSPATA